MDSDWMIRGNCRHEAPATMFPSDGEGVRSAMQVCAGCPVRVECLEYALANDIEHGVWGGASNRQRRRINRQRRTDSPSGVT
jgi:WhiB family redox-sensing transcriptional regulator